MTDASGGIVAVVSLYARPGQDARLEEFERQAAAIMREHGGRLERVIRVSDSPDSGQPPREVHIVWFPSARHLASYRDDPRFAALAALRASAIDRTTILVGRDAPLYV